MAAAEALLPPLLPTPSRSEMLALLPTPHGLVLTMLVSAMPGRADFIQRWDWNKKSKKPCSSICSSSSSEGGESAGRADSVERWDWNKKCKKPCSSICSSSSSSSSVGSESTNGRADSVDRWDSNKKYKNPRTTMSSSSSSSYSAGSPGRADSVERWDSKKKLATSSLPTDGGRHDGNNKRLPSPSRASSAERWDLHKKPRPEQIEKQPRTNAAATTPALATTTTPQKKAVFAGPSFYASPEPGMLPMPTFFLLAHSRALCTST